MYVLIADKRRVRDEEEEREGIKRVRLRNFRGRWPWVKEERLEDERTEEFGYEFDERGEEEEKGGQNNVGSNDVNWGIVPPSNVRHRR